MCLCLMINNRKLSLFFLFGFFFVEIVMPYLILLGIPYSKKSSLRYVIPDQSRYSKQHFLPHLFSVQKSNSSRCHVVAKIGCLIKSGLDVGFSPHMSCISHEMSPINCFHQCTLSTYCNGWSKSEISNQKSDDHQRFGSVLGWYGLRAAVCQSG